MKKLIRMTVAHMKTKPNIKLKLGCSFTAIKQKMNPANDSFDEVELNVVDEQRVRYEIDPKQLYNVESVKPTIRNLRAQMINGFTTALEKFKGSGWSVKRIDSLFAITHTLKAARGSSYIITPAKWKHPKCGLINIQNHDQECFRWCMLYHQSEKTAKSHRTTALAKLTDKYNYTGITFPISYDHITAFEHMNELMINVYKEDEETKKLHMHRGGNVMYCKTGMVNLLLIENEEGEAHYIYIKKLEHLLNTVTQSFYKDKKFCPFCAKAVCCKTETFEEHLMDRHFSTTNNCNLELPEEGDSMRFKNHKDKMERPFMVYADWECSLIKTHEEGKTHRHVANSCAFYFVCTFDETRNQYLTFEGPKCTVEMITALQELAAKCIKEMRQNTKMCLTPEEELKHIATETCMLCNEGFGEKGRAKVRDHDHRTGDYRGACHNACNINYFSNRYLPVFIHNLRGYDAHLILREAYELVPTDKIDAIPQTTEKFMTFSIGYLKFKVLSPIHL